MKLTLPQQDIFFEQLLFPNDPIYNIGAKVSIKGKLDHAVLNQAYIALINQHDSYRTTFVKENGTNKIVIQEKFDRALGGIDFSNSPNPEEMANHYMQQNFLKPFNLMDGDLLHTFALIKVSDDFHYLFSFYHHIITDGWGTSLMFSRFVQNYNEILEFGAIQTEYPFSYKDFVEEDEEYQHSETYQKDKDYWVEKFKDLPENLFENEKEKTNKSSRKKLSLKREQYNALNLLAKELKASTFHLLLAVLYVYFSRKQQTYDIGVGVPVLNRGKFAYKRTVGLFMGVNSLRIKVDQEQPFGELVQQIRQQLRQDYRHTRFPLGKLIHELGIYREKERLFNITLSYEKQDYSVNFAHTETRVIPLSHQAERVALALYIREFDSAEDVDIDFDYNLNYFDENSISQLVGHFERLIQDILQRPQEPIKSLNFLSQEERNLLLYEFNNTQGAAPKVHTFLDHFSAQAKQRPDELAVKDIQGQYSYKDLDQLSDQLAAHIKASFGENDYSPVAVMLDRSAQMLALLLAIMKTGRPYIPLDPSFPEKRLNYILQHSQAKQLITEKGYQLEHAENVVTHDLDDMLAKAKKLKPTKLPSVDKNASAYIIYTSGSTGKPKGVEIGHSSLLNFLTSIQKEPGITSKDMLFSVTTYSFDISILEFFVPLIAGASLYIANQQTLADPLKLMQRLKAEEPSIIQATPSFYQLLFNAGWTGDSKLKVLCGGDLLSSALAQKLLDNCAALWNMYGPTETTIWSSIKKIENAAEASNIGRPIQDTQFYLLDQHLGLLPIGARGNLYIGGKGLAKGYYHNEVLTDQKFIPNPFIEGNLIYETGDIGKWNNNGEINFLGRNDHQVKIRGFRIELGEIESKLNLMPEIEEAVLIAKNVNSQDAFLVAYIRTSTPVDSNQILKRLGQDLPQYMIPATLVEVKEFPLTPNKKVDRKTLSQRSIQSAQEGEKLLPQADLEKELAQYWNEILGSDLEIARTDNFFSLGGHSLNAVKLLGLINKNRNCNLQLKALFDYPVLQSLAQHIETAELSDQRAVLPVQNKDYYPLTPEQYILWLASQKAEKSIAYNMSSAYQVGGKFDLEKVNKAINRIIDKYEILRTNFVEVNGEPQQKIKPSQAAGINIEVIQAGQYLDVQIHEILNAPFDLENDLLLRMHLIQLEDGGSLLLFATHHIVMDAWSLELFIKDLIANYQGIADKALSLQFKDCAEWIREETQLQEEEKQLFWSNHIPNNLTFPTFETDFEDEEEGEHYAGRYSFSMGKNTSKQLKLFCLEKEVTPHTLLATALLVLISRLSDSPEVGFAITNAGRKAAAFNDQIGMFVKTLLLHKQLDNDQPFYDCMQEVQKQILAIDSHQDLPIELLSKFRFDVLFTYQNPEFSYNEIDGAKDFKLKTFETQSQFSRLPIVFNLFEKKGNIQGSIEYDAGLYDEKNIELLYLKYQKVVETVLNDHRVQLRDINVRPYSSETIDIDFNF